MDSRTAHGCWRAGTWRFGRAAASAESLPAAELSRSCLELPRDWAFYSHSEAAELLDGDWEVKEVLVLNGQTCMLCWSCSRELRVSQSCALKALTCGFGTQLRIRPGLRTAG